MLAAGLALAAACGPPGGGSRRSDAGSAGDAAGSGDGFLAFADAGGDGPAGLSCSTYCTQLTQICTGDHAQFGSQQQCLAWCSEWAAVPLGEPGDKSGNTVACRLGQVEAAAGDAASAQALCDAAGPSGGDVCGTFCGNYCALAQKNCATLFAGSEDCAAACAAFPPGGSPGDMTGDSVQCRLWHAALAGGVDSEANCKAAATDGGGVCTGACIRSCAGKECGPDGCGGTCGSCGSGSVCENGACQCEPQCAGKECGDDGCGGSCGACGPAESCQGGQCLCAPACAGKECGDDGCGGSCGHCEPGASCVEGHCGGCVPDCADKECGDDGCGATCGYCGFGEVCELYECVCVPDCELKECGDDACGGSCGTCTGGAACVDGECACKPQCAGKACGDDGCGGACGYCSAGKICQAGVCVACTPQCTGKQCGDDGCAGSCGTCPAGQSCTAGVCSGGGGDSCAGYCGEAAPGGCYCDNDCIEAGDCCGDVCDACPGTTGCGPCTPACAGKECGDDGCGGSCGVCAAGQSCVTGECAGCVPSCQGMECGDDGCGGSCGTCPAGQSCAGGICTGGSGSSCEGHCGSSAPGGCFCDSACFGYGDCCADVCTWCKASYPDKCGTCTPSCAGKECGSDGCGGSCGKCSGVDTCVDGTCECTPSCAGKVCGTDGCEGTCGTCTAGSTCQDGQCISGPLPGKLVVNEIDYDQPGDDHAEFLELLNTGGQDVLLSGYRVEAVNGNGAAVYKEYDLGKAATKLAPGQYLVIGVQAVLDKVSGTTIEIAAPDGFLQNGGPDGDAVRIMLGATVMDAVSYEAKVAGAGEGTCAPEDLGTDGSLCRCPNGNDTGDNGADFILVPVATPGAPNACG